MLAYAEAIARRTADGLDQPATVSAGADRALEESALMSTTAKAGASCSPSLAAPPATDTPSAGQEYAGRPKRR